MISPGQTNHEVFSDGLQEMDEHMRSMLHHRELEKLKGRWVVPLPKVNNMISLRFIEYNKLKNHINVFAETFCLLNVFPRYTAFALQSNKSFDFDSRVLSESIWVTKHVCTWARAAEVDIGAAVSTVAHIFRHNLSGTTGMTDRRQLAHLVTPL